MAELFVIAWDERCQRLVDRRDACPCRLCIGNTCGFELVERSAKLRMLRDAGLGALPFAGGDDGQRGLVLGRADAVGREGGPVLGKRVRKLEPSELALFDEDLAEQRAALALHLEGCFSIVRCDESEVDEDLPDRTTDAESERGDGWDDHGRLDLGLLGPSASPFSCESSREISGWGTANSATTIWSSGSPVLSANLSARSSCSGTSRFSSTRSGPRNSGLGVHALQYRQKFG